MASPDLVPIFELSPAQLDQLALGHLRELPTGLAELGLPMVRRFYKSLRTHSPLFGVAALLQGRVVGAVVGSPEPDHAFDAITRPLPQFILHVLLYRRRVLPQLIWSKLRPAHQEARPNNSADLMYIFVGQAARGQGLGRALVEAFCEEGFARGHAAITLSVETNNISAIRLYEKLGFSTTRAGRREGRHVRQRMALHRVRLPESP